MTAGNAQVSFLNSTSSVFENADEEEAEVRATTPIQSPFVSVYESIQGEGDYHDPFRKAYAIIVDNRYDEEFDEALFELTAHWPTPPSHTALANRRLGPSRGKLNQCVRIR